MNILVTGGCGFVGTNLSIFLKKKGFNVSTLDNFVRKGSRFNYITLKKLKIKNYNLDISNYSNIKKLPKFDFILDCCAEAAVEVSKNEIDRVINTNLIGTLNILKKAKQDKSKIIFLSSSRVYSINNLNKLVKNKIIKNHLRVKKKIKEDFDTQRPKSIYGFTKLSSEMLIEEFSFAFGLKYIINRCGVISGPFQFGKQDQGFVSLWIWRHLNRNKLSYIGYGGFGNQVRDVLHIDDLCNLIFTQLKKFKKINNQIFNVGGSKKSNVSLKNLTHICQKVTGEKIYISKTSSTSVYDIPYYITDNTKVTNVYGWKPKNSIYDVINDTYKWLNTNKLILRRYL
jgi:CDP-paratose 2-epimerase